MVYPVAFEQTEDALSVYLEYRITIAFSENTGFVPLLSDEEVVAMVVELMKKILLQKWLV